MRVCLIQILAHTIKGDLPGHKSQWKFSSGLTPPMNNLLDALYLRVMLNEKVRLRNSCKNRFMDDPIWNSRRGICFLLLSLSMSSIPANNLYIKCNKLKNNWLGHFPKWEVSQLETKYCMILLIGGPWRNQIRGSKCRRGFSRVWKRADRELMFSGDRVSVWEDEKCSGDGWWWWLYNNVDEFNTTKLYVSK